MANALEASAITAHRILALGDTGSGKTTQFLTLPGRKFAYLFDPNALLSLQGHDVEYEEFFPDKLNLAAQSLSQGKGDKNHSGAKSDAYGRWEKDFNARCDSGFFDDYDVIGMDSATTFLDLIMDRVLTINGRYGSVPQQDDYGPQMLAFTNVCRQLTSLGKTIYFTGHMETKQDALTKRIFNLPMFTGKLRVKIPLLFTSVFLFDAQESQGKIKHRIQTAPDQLSRTVRTSIKGLDPFEDVTVDFSKPLAGQGLGGIIEWEKKELLKK